MRPQARSRSTRSCEASASMQAGRTSRAARNVEPQRGGRSVAAGVHHVERTLDLPLRRAEPLQKACTRLSRYDAPRASCSSLTPSAACSRRTASLSPDTLTPLARAPSRNPPARGTVTRAFRASRSAGIIPFPHNPRQDTAFGRRSLIPGYRNHLTASEPEASRAVAQTRADATLAT